YACESGERHVVSKRFAIFVERLVPVRDPGVRAERILSHAERQLGPHATAAEQVPECQRLLQALDAARQPYPRPHDRTRGGVQSWAARLDRRNAVTDLPFKEA